METLLNSPQPANAHYCTLRYAAASSLGLCLLSPTVHAWSGAARRRKFGVPCIDYFLSYLATGTGIMPLMGIKAQQHCWARRLVLLTTALVCSIAAGVVHNLGDADFDELVDSLPEDALLLVDFYRVSDSLCESWYCVSRACFYTPVFWRANLVVVSGTFLESRRAWQSTPEQQHS